MQLASTILMIRPANFGFNAETAKDNVFQSPQTENINDLSQQAIQEFDNMVHTLRQNAINVLQFEDTSVPPKPDAVFSNNWLCTLPTGELFTFPVMAENRRHELREDIILRLKNTFEVQKFIDYSEKAADDLFLESTGSMVFDHTHKGVYAVKSKRTDKDIFEHFAAEIGYKPFMFSASTKSGNEIYHTNVMMHIGDTYAVICLEAIDTVKEQIQICNALRNSGHDIIAISYEQMNAFAGNMLQLNNNNDKKITVLSATAFDALTSEQKSIFNRHTDLLPVSVNTIEAAGGGSARCMITEIFLKAKHMDL